MKLVSTSLLGILLIAVDDIHSLVEHLGHELHTAMHSLPFETRIPHVVTSADLWFFFT
jgi:hypothetical protein